MTCQQPSQITLLSKDASVGGVRRGRDSTRGQALASHAPAHGFVSDRDKSARSHFILTALTRDIQCEKFIEDESVSHESCDSMYPNIYKLAYLKDSNAAAHSVDSDIFQSSDSSICALQDLT